MDQILRSPWTLAVMLAALAVEFVWRWKSGRGVQASAALTSLGVAGGNLLFGALNRAGIGLAFAAVWRLAPHRLPLDDWRIWLAGFVGVEFIYYWVHRLNHRVRWMWATHSVHHSSEEMTFLSAIRLGWTNLFSGGWVLYLPLVLLGLHPAMVAALIAFNLQYQFFLHTEARISLGPLERILNSPSHHRVHHGANARYLDCNYGGVLIVWDRLFGTFQAELAEEPVRFGLVNRPVEANPIRLNLREWRLLLADMRAAGGLPAAARVAFGPP